MSKLRKMSAITLVVLYVSVYIPVIIGSINLLGNTANYQVNITNLNFGFGFNVIFLLMMLFGSYTLYYNQKLKQISDWVIIVILAAFLMILIAAKDSTESFGIGYVILWFDWIAMILIKFLPDIMINVYDYVVKLFDKLGDILSKNQEEKDEAIEVEEK
jgi:hypothetical protein